MKPQRSLTLNWLAIAACVAALPFIITAIIAIPTENDDVSHWLPEGEEARDRYDRFLQQFGNDDLLIIAWTGCTLDDDRVSRLAGALREYTDKNPDRPQYFRKIITGPEEVSQLMSKPAKLERDEALRRLRGVIVGPTDETTCIIAEIADAGKAAQHQIIETVRSEALKACSIKPEMLRLGGSVYETVVIDEASQRTLDENTLPSAVVSLLLCFYCLRSIRLTTIVLTTSIYCQMVSIALLYYLGGHLNAILVVMPTLVYVLSISGAIHLVNYYRDHRETGAENQESARWALRIGWFPCTLASISTAFGLSSLAVSKIAPVKDFGIYSALAMIVALVVLLLIVPALLMVWPERSKKVSSDVSYDAAIQSHFGITWLAGVIRRSNLITFIGFSIIVFFGAGLTKLQTTVKFERMFDKTSDIVRDYRWLEERIGPTVPIEVVLGFDKSCELSRLKRLELLDTLSEEIRKIPDVGAVTSAATFVGKRPTSRGIQAGIRRKIYNEKLNSQTGAFRSSGWLADSEGRELWRLTARIPALHDLDYGEFVTSVRNTSQGVLRSHELLDSDSVDLTLTGLSPVIFEAQLQLFEDLFSSFTLAFLLIYPIMCLFLRGLRTSLIAMIPNVAPAVLVFGGMGWCGFEVDIGSVLCASVALGIAVDDTTHFLTWYRRGIRDGLDPADAVRHAFRHCAKAMFQTTMICSLGMLVFLFCDFVPAQRFAALLFLMLWGALAGDLILLPALIIGPFRRLFASSRAAEVCNESQELGKN